VRTGFYLFSCMNAFRTHVDRAVTLHGSQVKLAKEVGCSQQYISWLLNEADQVSAEMAIAFERATCAAISRHDLRPDIFGSAPERAA
jgi:DNA-binding transcriptional regulator YdaS (Cro superfamily)